MRRSTKWFLAFLVIVFAGCAWLHFNLRAHLLAFVPASFGVHGYLYAKETRSSQGGFFATPASGLIAYEMPDALAKSLDEGGLGWLRSLKPQDGQTREVYKNWMPTPVQIDKQWRPASSGSSPQWSHPDIRDYMFPLGFSMDVDLDVAAQANEAVFNEGSFYAYGRIGVLALDPKARRIYYAYNR